jgi:tripartite-type tricarboxylate transporter receptor subunit TctC
MNFTRAKALRLHRSAAPARAGGAARPWADTWPNRPVRMIVAYPPGQSTDIAARYFATKLSDRARPAGFVENKAGAFGNIGTAFAARQRPTATR